MHRDWLSFPTCWSPEGIISISSAFDPTVHPLFSQGFLLWSCISRFLQQPPPFLSLSCCIMGITTYFRSEAVYSNWTLLFLLHPPPPQGPHILLSLSSFYFFISPLTFEDFPSHTGLFCCCSTYSSSSGAFFSRELEVTHPALHNFHNLKRNMREEDTMGKEPIPHFKSEDC